LRKLKNFFIPPFAMKQSHDTDGTNTVTEAKDIQHLNPCPYKDTGWFSSNLFSR
jgi:hypothetical protein